MESIRPNAVRVNRFRELKATLRTRRDRLLVGIDVAKVQHVAQVRLAHTRILDPQLIVPNTRAGFAAFWAHLAARQAETGAEQLVSALEPTGTYHQALAAFLEAQGADVVLVSTHVAQLNRRTLDGTWGKSDPKDAHNLCDLLEQGKVLFYSLPGQPLADLRRLVRLLRRVRVERAACQARFRNTLLPTLAPAGEPLPPAQVAALPLPLRALLPVGQRAASDVPAALPAGLAAELSDLAARLTAVQARSVRLERALVWFAEPLPAHALLRTIPGVGPTVAAILLAEIGDIAWDHPLQPAPEARRPRHHRRADGAVGGRDPDLEVWPAAPALGALPGGAGRGPHPGLAGAACGAAGEAHGRSVCVLQDERRAGRQTSPHRVGRVAEWPAL